MSGIVKLVILLAKGAVKRGLYIYRVSRGEVQSTSTLNNWARYVDKINKQDQG